MLPVERVIGDEGLAATPGGARLAVRLPWYRSLPLSTIRIDGLAIDGRQIDLSDVSLEVDSRSWPLAKLEEQTDASWFVLDSAFLLVPSLSLERGSEHNVEVTLSVFPPYIPGMKRVNAQSEILRVH